MARRQQSNIITLFALTVTFRQNIKCHMVRGWTYRLPPVRVVIAAVVASLIVLQGFALAASAAFAGSGRDPVSHSAAISAVGVHWSRRYGYEWDGMTICEPEAAVIRECIERSINGEMAWRIARDLNERGVPTTYGKKWVTANLQRMLLSPRIIGVRRHLGVDYPAQWPAITTPEEQERIRIVWRSRRQTPGRPRGARTYLLTGFAYCGRCDQPMRGNGRTLASGAYQRRYRCSPIDIHGESLGCGHMFRAAEPLEQFVSEAVLYRFDSPEIALALAGPGQEGEIAKIVTEIEFCRQKLNDYVDDYASGLLDRTQLARAKARTESELDEHQDRLSSLQRLQNASRLPNEPLRYAWNEMELESKREVIQLVVERVIVHPGLPGVKTWESFRLNPEQIEIVWRV